MSEWIATRWLRDEAGKAVCVSLSAPLDTGGLWRCTVRLEEEGVAARDGDAHGVDAFQALQNGMERIYVELEALGRPLTWLAPGDSGFARSVPLGLGVTFRRRVQRLIDDEIEAYTDALKARGTTA